MIIRAGQNMQKEKLNYAHRNAKNIYVEKCAIEKCKLTQNMQLKPKYAENMHFMQVHIMPSSNNNIEHRLNVSFACGTYAVKKSR